MNMNPTSTQRIVVIDIQTRTTDGALPNLKAAACTEVITGIQMIADDGVQVMEAVFYAAPERDLLRGFWSAVQPDDVFYGNQVFDRLGLLRRRTWAWGLIPARELDLPRVYQHRMVDTAGLPSGAGDSTFRSAEALATVLGLSGMPIGDNKH